MPKSEFGTDLLRVETARLLLRIFTPADITTAYLDGLNDPNIVSLTEARHRRWDKETASAFILESTVVGKSLLFGVFLRTTSKPIGNIRLFNLHPIHKRAELSFLFYDREKWGFGYATEALQALTEYAYRELGLHRIHADYYESNIASRRVFEKIGFQEEGRFIDHFFVNGEYQDSIRVGKVVKR